MVKIRGTYGKSLTAVIIAVLLFASAAVAMPPEYLLAMFYGSNGLPSDGLLAYYDMVPGADPAVLYDRSGNSRNGAFASGANAPAQMKQGLSFFKGSTTYATVPAAALISGDNPLTIMVSGHQPQVIDGYYNCLFGYAAVAGLHAAPGVYLSTALIPAPQLRTGGGDNLTMTGTVGTTPNVITLRYLPTGTKLYGNIGTGASENKTLSGALAANSASGATVGAYANTHSDPLNGHVFGVAVWNRYLTDAEVAKAARIMAPPTNNDLLVFDGNSLTYSSNIAGLSTYPNQTVTALRAGWQWYNFGVHGQTTTQMSSDFDTQIKPLFNASREKQVLIAWEIGNQLAGLGAATAYANFRDYCLHARSVLPANTKIIALTVTPRVTSGFNDLRNAANALLVENWVSFADALVDVAADDRIGDDDDYADTTYYQADGIHMTAAGYAVIAGLVEDAILEVTSETSPPSSGFPYTFPFTLE